MTIEEAIQKAIEGGKRRNPQDWLITGGGISITSIDSKNKTYHIKADTKEVEKTLKYFRWYMKDGYAVTSIKYKKIKMHHAVLGKPEKGQEVDHINRDRLDNRRKNLRFVSSMQNSHNTKPLGIRKRGLSWEANICINYKKHFKSFKTLKEAKKWRQEMKDNFVNTL